MFERKPSSFQHYVVVVDVRMRMESGSLFCMCVSPSRIWMGFFGQNMDLRMFPEAERNPNGCDGDDGISL